MIAERRARGRACGMGDALEASGAGQEDELARLRAQFAAANDALDGLRPTPEQLRVEAAAAEQLAAAEGDAPKTSRAVQTLLNRWNKFIEMHGDAYGFDEAEGPTIELAVHFQTDFIINSRRDFTVFTHTAGAIRTHNGLLLLVRGERR